MTEHSSNEVSSYPPWVRDFLIARSNELVRLNRPGFTTRVLDVLLILSNSRISQIWHELTRKPDEPLFFWEIRQFSEFDSDMTRPSGEILRTWLAQNGEFWHALTEDDIVDDSNMLTNPLKTYTMNFVILDAGTRCCIELINLEGRTERSLRRLDPASGRLGNEIGSVIHGAYTTYSYDLQLPARWRARRPPTIG